MTQRNIDIMDMIVSKLEGGEKFSHALSSVYLRRNVCIPYQEEMDDVPITSLPMSHRAINAIMRGRLQTIGDVVKYCKDHKITDVANVGKTVGVELFETILDYCWSHMDREERVVFLIDTVERNKYNVRAEIV